MWVYTGYGIAFDEACSWNISNDFVRNVKLFGINNSSSSHTDIRKKKFLVLGEGRTYGSFGSPEKKFSINFSKANTKFYLGLHYNADNNYLLVKGKEIFKFQADNKRVNFLTQFSLGSISNGFSATESREVSLNSHFSVDYYFIDKSDIFISI